MTSILISILDVLKTKIPTTKNSLSFYQQKNLYRWLKDLSVIGPASWPN